jgi:hypothetical protein
MNRKPKVRTSWMATLALAALSFLLAGLTPPRTQAQTTNAHPSSDAPAELNSPTATESLPIAEVLKNMTYHIAISDTPQSITLHNGEAKVGSTSIALGKFASGHFRNDRDIDAVAVIGWSGGGSGYFESLVAIKDVYGARTVSPEQPLGDRIKIESLSIKNQQAQLTIITQGPNDPMCCPTKKETMTFALKDGRLVKTSQ